MTRVPSFIPLELDSHVLIKLIPENQLDPTEPRGVALLKAGDTYEITTDTAIRRFGSRRLDYLGARPCAGQGNAGRFRTSAQGQD